MLRTSRQPSRESENFYSLQAEGVATGVPTVFLRLATRNLTCSRCDTKYTWDWSNYDYETKVASVAGEEVEDLILEYGRPHLVISEGEPLLQQRVLVPLALSLSN